MTEKDEKGEPMKSSTWTPISKSTIAIASSKLESALGTCNRTLQAQLNMELKRVYVELDNNRERVALARQYEGNCSRMWWSTLEAVIYWQENRPFDDDHPEDAFTDACTREERDYLLVRGWHTQDTHAHA